MMIANQKHYKIIFIKAPSSAAKPPMIAPAAQNEEKTLVYVLVKKPQETQEIVLPTAPPTVPSKPEVYFIRYSHKTKNNGKQQEGSQGEYPNSIGSPLKTSYGTPSFDDTPSQDFTAPAPSNGKYWKYLKSQADSSLAGIVQ